MTALQTGAEDYLTLRRSLGFKLKRPCRFVRDFGSAAECDSGLCAVLEYDGRRN
jgi:hypothetical protein